MEKTSAEFVAMALGVLEVARSEGPAPEGHHVIRRLRPTPRARARRARDALWALYGLTWLGVALWAGRDASPATGADWALLGLMAASGAVLWLVTR